MHAMPKLAKSTRRAMIWTSPLKAPVFEPSTRFTIQRSCRPRSARPDCASDGAPGPLRKRLPHRSEHQGPGLRSEEHTSELQSLMRISYAVFCLKKKKHTAIINQRVCSTTPTKHQQ